MKQLLVLVVFSLACVGYSSSQTSHSDNYRDLVQRLKSGDRTVDFTEFRMAFADSSEFRAPDSALANHANSALSAGHYEDTLSDAGKMLDEDYADIQAHFLAYRAHKELGHRDQTAYHQFIYEGLLNSIEKSGDGKSPATAYVVISMTEVFMPVFRDQIKKGTKFGGFLVDDGPHHWIRFEGVDARSNQPLVLFFNIDIPRSRIKDAIMKKNTVGTT